MTVDPPHWIRTVALALGGAALAFATGITLGWNDAATRWAALGAAGVIFGATAPLRPLDRADQKPAWQRLLSHRNMVAATIALASLGIIWWGWAWLSASSASSLMDPLVALITAVLGYLFGRGEAETAEKRTDIAKTQLDQVTEKGEAAAVAAQDTSSILGELAERAKTDKGLKAHLVAAYRVAKQRKDAHGERQKD